MERKFRPPPVKNRIKVTAQAPSEACPCCGYKTLAQRADYDICPVCWWQDDGQDNEDADEVRGGPNKHLSLSAARANFLKFGIFDPARTDLLEKRASPYDFERIRIFRLEGDAAKEEG